MKFDQRLREIRKKKGYSQTLVAKETGIGNVTLSQYENGVRTPDIETLTKLANYFGVSTDYLLGNSSDPELTAKDEKDIARRIEEITQDLENTEVLMLHGEIMDDETKDLIKSAMETAVKISKKASKKKFTPKKYKK